MDELTGQCIGYARQLSQDKCFGKSIELYLMAFDKSPNTKSPLEEEFRAVLLRANEALATGNRFEEIFINFGRALEAYPDNKFLLNDIGKYLYKFSFYPEAWWHFNRALSFDANFVNAEKNLNSVKNILVERWHFRMLNDTVRNAAYHDAIRDTLQRNPKHRVLDIGTGSGLLAMYASLYKPQAITACEASSTMADLAENVTEENNINNISIITKMSTTVKPTDIGGKCSLVVTEMFDAGLLGEHILPSLAHAWDCLIDNGGEVIPNKAEFFVIAARCDLLRSKYQLNSDVKEFLNVSNLNVHILTNDETYDCEDVHLFKDIKYMSEPQSLMKVDFNNQFDVQEKLAANEPISIDFKVTETGYINIYVGWFNLQLSENITLTTNPRSGNRANAWQQAIFFDNPQISVQENQVVTAKFLLNAGKLTMPHEPNSCIWRVSPEIVRFLNDSEYLKMIWGSVAPTCVYLNQLVDISQMTLVDLCPFPMYGLHMLKRGALSLTCYARNNLDKHFFERVFKANKIPLAKITVLVGEHLTQEVFKDNKYHAICVNILDMCGDLDLMMKDMSLHLRDNHLYNNGLVIPANVKLVAQIVNSPWMDINNRVYDENVNNFKIAKFMNKFEVSQNFCVDSALFDYEAISDPVVIDICSNEMMSSMITMPVVKDGFASGILCWYSIQMLEDLNEISTKRDVSFIDTTIFLASPKVQLASGETAIVLLCVDEDGTFRLSFDSN